MRVATALSKQGFAVVSLSPESAHVLRKALMVFAEEKTFRFPPREAEICWRPEYRLAFDVMYRECREVWGALMAEGLVPNTLPHPPAEPAFISETDQDSSVSPPFSGLRGSSLNPYASTFFNLLNYDYGCLNTHQDRGLLTLNYGLPGHADPRARLWLRALADNATHTGEQDREWRDDETQLKTVKDKSVGSDAWRDAEVLVSPQQALLFAGEELQQLDPRFVPIEHSVRVDPDGEYLPLSHSVRDPQACSPGNRLSCAMVFSCLQDE